MKPRTVARWIGSSSMVSRRSRLDRNAVSVPALLWRVGSAGRWQYIGRWVAPTIVHSFWVRWARADGARRLGLKRLTSPNIVIDGHTLLERPGLYGEIEARVARELRQDRWGTPFTNRIFEAAAGVERESNRFMARYRGRGESFDALETALRLHQEAVFPHQALFAGGDAVETALRAAGAPGDIQTVRGHRQALSMVDHTRLQSFRRQLASRRLINASFKRISRSAPKIAQRLKRYQRQTEWIGTFHFWGEPRTMARLLLAIREVDNAASRPKVTRQVPVRVRRLLRLAATAAFWRMQSADHTARFIFAVRPALTKLGAQYGMTNEEVVWATTDEILDAIHHRGDLRPREIRSRMNGFVLGTFNRTGALDVLTGPTARNTFLRHFRLGRYGLTGKSHQLHGLVACRGVVRGRVAVVLTPHDIKRVKKGMVLVAPETTPDFVPAMKRAAAFVTDLGGITSHAAIVARELDTPCIIGTKFATEVLKDGDLVEVDANRGIVRRMVK